MNLWEWPTGTHCAAFFSVNFDAESLDLHSTSEKRLFGRFSYGRYGTRAGFPRLIALLRRHAIPATFFVPAADARRHPDLVRVLLDEGHEVGARGLNLENFSE